MLRGINVSGHKKIKMADLREHMATLGYINLETYIQSGNIVFQSTESNQRKIELDIHNNIKSNYGFDVPVIVVENAELKQVIESNPFPNQPGIVEKDLAITFLSEEPAQGLKENIPKTDGFEFGEKVIYLNLPEGAGNTKLTTNFFEGQLKVRCTARNLRTTNKLLEMATGLN